MKFVTYIHLKLDNSIFYVGKGIERRAKSKHSRNQHWKNTVKKYGGFKSEILAYWGTEEEAFSHEKLLISCFKDMGYKLVNKTDGGEGNSGYKWNKDQLKTLSEVHKGINKGLFAGNKCWFYNKIKTENYQYRGAVEATNTKTGEKLVLEGSKDMEEKGFNRNVIYKCLSSNYPNNKTYKGFTFKRIDNNEQQIKNSNIGN
jgi:hypothetical protein